MNRRSIVAAALVGVLGVVAASIAFNLATLLVVFAVGFVLAGVIPFGVGFVVQRMVVHRTIPDLAWAAMAVVLMLPWWFWGKGFAVSVPGPRIFSLGLSALYLGWFSSLGAAVARSSMSRAAEGPDAPRPGHA